MEYTENILNYNKGLITSLLRVFTIFDFRLIDDRDKVKAISSICINCKQKTGLYLGNTTLEKMITKSVLNTLLHFMGMS